MARMTQVRPATPSDATPPAHDTSARRRLTDGSFELTVEWSGRYSVDKTLALLAASASTTRSDTAFWLLVTPLTALAMPLALELIPLHDPFLFGWRGNSAYFLRSSLRGVILSFCVDSQVDLYIPEQKLPLTAVLLLNVLQSATSMLAAMLVSALTGVFPIPFVIVAIAPFHAVIAWSLHLVFGRLLLPAERDPLRVQGTKQRLPQVMRLIGFSLPLLYVYNFFAAGFSRAPERYQVALAVLLQLIKLLMTHRHWSISHIGSRHYGQPALDTSGDLATAHVASGARFFHALFTTTCLQKSKSSNTLVVVVCFSVLQELFMIRGLRERERRVQHATTDLQNGSRDESHHDGFWDTLACIAERARRLDRRLSSTSMQASQRAAEPSYSVYHEQAHTAVSRRPSCSHRQACSEPLTTHESAFLASATRLLQCQEAALLRLYVEIFVPILYFVYVALVPYTPNITFLPTLQIHGRHGLQTLAERLAVQVAVKVFTLVFILSRHCREPGGLRQLAFAMSSMRSVILGNCVPNALCVLDFPLLHNGHDFSFQFQWLHHHHI